MKNIYALLLICLTALVANAQGIKKKMLSRSFTVDKSITVQDTAGKLLNYEEWNPLVRSSKYMLLPVDFSKKDNHYILTRQGHVPKGYRIRAIEPQETVSPTPLENTPAPPEVPSAPVGDPYDYMAGWPKPNESEYFKVGEEIQSFNSHDINGNKISLKDLKGKVVVLNFFFIGCPACMEEVPELNDVVNRYKDNSNVVFVSISLDTKGYIKTFLNDTPFNYHIISEGTFLARKYGIGLYPTNLVLDKEGKVAMHWVGRSPSAPYWMKKTIDKIL
jgi:peroxiredoxin